MKKLFIILLSLLASSCAGVKVASIQNPTIQFDQYKTFCWIQGCEQNYEGPDYGYSLERMQRLMDIIKAELEAKGLVHDENNPDLMVGFHMVVEEKEAILANSSQMMDPYERQITYWEGYADFYREEIYRFLQRSLIIDLIDAGSGEVMWQSTAQRYMELDQEISEEKMIKGVQRALKDFPSISGK